MDQITLVDRRIDDGQKLVLQLARDGLGVTAAFWLRPSDEDWWHLYIASKLVDEQGPTAAYRRVQNSLQKLPGTSISLADVKIIEVDDPLVHDIIKIRKQYSGAAPIRFGGAQVGGTLIEEALIYPSVPAEKRSPLRLGKRRLKRAVQQTTRIDDINAPLSLQESKALGQIVASGVSPAQADYWIRKKREMEKGKQEIPAGTVVDAMVTAWWGETPEEDHNPLLLVKAPDGSEGLTFLENTESA